MIIESSSLLHKVHLQFKPCLMRFLWFLWQSSCCWGPKSVCKKCVVWNVSQPSAASPTWAQAEQVHCKLYFLSLLFIPSECFVSWGSRGALCVLHPPYDSGFAGGFAARGTTQAVFPVSKGRCRGAASSPQPTHGSLFMILLRVSMLQGHWCAVLKARIYVSAVKINRLCSSVC